MKKQSFLLTIALTAGLLFFLSCNKDETENNPKSKKELLTQASWKFKSASVGGTPFTTLPACQTDNTYKFNSDGSGVMDEGATKCDAGDPQTNPFTWTFQSGETEIVLSSPLFTNGGNTVTLVSVSETELVIVFPYSTPGPIFSVEVRFSH